MANSQVLKAYAQLLDVRRKAARRNGFIFGALFIVAIAIGVWVSGGDPLLGSDLPALAVIGILFTLMMSQSVTSEIVNKSILELIVTLERDDSDAA